MPAGPKRDDLIRSRVSPAQECSFNAQGRIQLPQALRNSAGLDKDKDLAVIVVGMFEKIEIWSQSAHEKIIQESELLLNEDAQGQADLGF